MEVKSWWNPLTPEPSIQSTGLGPRSCEKLGCQYHADLLCRYQHQDHTGTRVLIYKNKAIKNSQTVLTSVVSCNKSFQRAANFHKSIKLINKFWKLNKQKCFRSLEIQFQLFDQGIGFWYFEELQSLNPHSEPELKVVTENDSLIHYS